MKKAIYFTGLFALVSNVIADTNTVNTELLKSSLNSTAEIKQVSKSSIPGLYEVQINNQIVYLTADGEKVISGDVYDLKNKYSHTEKSKQRITKNILATVDDKDKIIYKAKDEKYKISVFTDISCPYCSKLHQEVAELNNSGVTVEYLAFPRAGVGSTSQKSMQKIWCSENKTIALTEAKKNGQIPKKSCAKNQTIEQFLLGQEIGVNATPTIIFPDGSIQPGYSEAKYILAYLKKVSAANTVK